MNIVIIHLSALVAEYVRTQSSRLATQCSWFQISSVIEFPLVVAIVSSQSIKT